MGKLMKCPLNEYAKVVWHKIDVNGKGVQARVTLPSAKTIKPNDFINFYLGFGEYEIGLSTRTTKLNGDDNPNPDNKWRWFVNSTAKMGETDFTQPWIYSDGETVTIKAFFNSVGQVEFHVNGVKVWQGTAKTTGTVSNCRFVIGCAQQSTGVGYPWHLLHNQVVVQNLMYRNANDAWVNVTSANGHTEYTNCPDNATEKQYIHTDINSVGGALYASLK